MTHREWGIVILVITVAAFLPFMLLDVDLRRKFTPRRLLRRQAAQAHARLDQVYEAAREQMDRLVGRTDPFRLGRWRRW